MRSYQLRAIAEKAELDIKRNALRDWIMSDGFKLLTDNQMEMLLAQQSTMLAYSLILGKRIGEFDTL